MSATVLVVDDEKNIRRTLRMVLEGAGFDVTEAETAEEALEQVDDADMVILDVRLPRMSGIDALKEIRRRPETARLPVLMISGHASVAEAVQAVQVGATDFFEKPLDFAGLAVGVQVDPDDPAPLGLLVRAGDDVTVLWARVLDAER